MRTPDHTATGAGGRHGAVRRGGSDGAAGDQPIEVGSLVVERAELRASGRPPTVTTVRSPSAARRTAAASSARERRGSDVDVDTCVHKQSCERRASAANIGAMNFAFTEEQEELRKTVRAFLDSKSPESAVREQMETEDGYDEAVWKQMAEQIGLQGLHIPEEFGGSGYGYVELGIVLEEMGRALLCAPFFSTVVLAGQHAAPQRRRRGEEGVPARASPAARRSPRSPSPSRRASGTSRASRATATPDGDGWTLNGTKIFVLDGHVANLIIVAARTGKGVSLFAVDGDARASPARRCRRWTRPASRPSSSSPTRRRTLIGTEGEGWDVLVEVLDLVAVGLAAEQVGGAQKVLDMAVEYAKVRVQFGRPIGSFQAIKHKCADMLLEVESAKSAAYYGLWCASRDERRAALGGLARQGLLLRGVLPRRRREHPDPRRHRLHVGAPGAPVLQAGQELRAAVRRPDVPPRAARPAHRHLIRATGEGAGAPAVPNRVFTANDAADAPMRPVDGAGAPTCVSAGHLIHV